MTQDIIDLVNTMGKEERVENRIQFFKIDDGATISDLYAANENDDDDICASDKDYELSKINEAEDQDEELDADFDVKHEEWVEEDDPADTENTDD